MKRKLVFLILVIVVVEIAALGYLAALGYRGTGDLDADGDGSVSFDEFVSAFTIRKQSDPERPNCARYLGLMGGQAIRVTCVSKR
jgi:hypothetical protein